MTVSPMLPIGPLLIFSPIGLKLVDALTGREPLATVLAALDRFRRDDAPTGAPPAPEDADWEPTEIRPAVNSSGLITYPGLERSAHPEGKKPRWYRVRVSASTYYVPFDPAVWPLPPSVPFLARPYGHFTPLDIDTIRTTFLATLATLLLLPAAGYPFPSEVKRLTGTVVDAGKAPLANALVEWQPDVDPDDPTHTTPPKVVALTSGRGEFVLPVRRSQDTFHLVATEPVAAPRPIGTLTVSRAKAFDPASFRDRTIVIGQDTNLP